VRDNGKAEDKRRDSPHAFLPTTFRLPSVMDPKIWTKKSLFLDGGRH
jgi:hypothetical protein